jgi:hypothetical protein
MAWHDLLSASNSTHQQAIPLVEKYGLEICPTALSQRRLNPCILPAILSKSDENIQNFLSLNKAETCKGIIQCDAQ